MKSIVATSVVIFCSVAIGADKETAKPTPEQKIRQTVVDQRKAELKDAKAELEEAKQENENPRTIDRLVKTIKELEMESQFWDGVADGSRPIPHTWLLKPDKWPSKPDEKPEVVAVVVSVKSETEFMGTYQERHYAPAGKFGGSTYWTNVEALFVGWDTAGFEKGKKVALPGYGIKFTKDETTVVQRVPDELISTKPLEATKTQPKAKAKAEK